MSGLVLALLTLSAASAQIHPDARVLLQQVSEAARAAKAFHAEGSSVVEMTAEGTLNRVETSFRFSTKGPQHLRWEATGANSGQRLCDGSYAWIHLARTNSYTRNTLQPSHCEPPIPRWDNLTGALVAAEVTGREQVRFNEATVECQAVRAEYESGAQILAGLPNASKTLLRTLCIDPTRNLIVRDRVESNSLVINLRTAATFTYSQAEWNPALPADTFQFQPPPGSLLMPPAQAPSVPGPSQTGVYRLGHGVTAPILIHRTEVAYTEEARQAKFQGTVLLSAVVGADGTPRDLRVARSLGLGLDEQAIECVKQWRFRPGQKEGQPVAVQVQIEVSFHLQ